MSNYPLLDQINLPCDLRALDSDKLYPLSVEIRDFILESVSQTGGHLASNLGCVELTIALHYVYNTPDDLLVWDVGHQTYTHKILTGRKDQMHTLRQFNGLSGFCKREESIYDTFGVGHSSTSISAALGMAIANKQMQIDNKVVAIIGDGSMSAGLAFEGLNNAGWLDTDMLIILNDNEMSISENVGAISRYCSKILASQFYNSVKQTANSALVNMPLMQKFAHKVEEHFKGMIIPSTLFEELGLNYIGPIDGHNIDELIEVLKRIKTLSGPQFLHIVTKKGNGYKLAQNNPIKYHGVSKFNIAGGLVHSTNTPLSYTSTFGRWLCDLAQKDKQFIAITPAMREGSGMVEFAEKYPEQFFDVGIAEQHAITFAAGAASQGVRAVVAIYSSFLQRGYDQLIHDVAIQNLPIVFAIDRAGVVGADGPTHIGAFDYSFLRCIPNIIVMAPSDENECYQMLTSAYKYNLPVALRYPRGGSGLEVLTIKEEMLELGLGVQVRTGKSIAILAFGSMVKPALLVASELDASVYNMRFIKPLDYALIKEVCAKYEYIVTLEENVIAGGAGSACLEYMHLMGLKKDVLLLGLRDEFLPHGDPVLLLKLSGLDPEGIITSIKNKWNL